MLTLIIAVICVYNSLNFELRLHDDDSKHFHHLHDSSYNISSSLLSNLDEAKHLQILVCSFNKSTRNAFSVDKQPKLLLLRFLCTFLMLQAGDLETNPGPRPLKYPCQICHLACKWGQCSVRCDSCDLWYHKDCMLMGTGVFEYLNTTEASWICCRCSIPNFNSSLFSHHDFTDSNPFSPLDNSGGNDFSDVLPLATSSPKHAKDSAKRTNTSGPRQRARRSTQRSTSSSCTFTNRNTTNNKILKVVVVNCQSVKNKSKEFGNMIHSTNPDVILATESWLNSSILDGEFLPDSYNIIRKDRTGKGGGGVFIAYRNDIVMTHRPDSKFDMVN